MPGCFSCGGELQVKSVVGRGDECEKCGADVHCCLNCRFYDKASYNECREPQAEAVKEKDRSNFCDYFELGGQGVKRDELDELRKAAEALFKK